MIYCVTVAIEADIETEWLTWMREVHIPEVLRTGCFVECRICKILEPESDQPTYVMQYNCRSLEEYHRYRESFAPALQEDHTDRFTGRFRASRELLHEVAELSGQVSPRLNEG